LQTSPLESSYVVVALTENLSTLKPLKISPERSQILSCDTVVANERNNRQCNLCLEKIFSCFVHVDVSMLLFFKEVREK
jgi:hypothetical protein